MSNGAGGAQGAGAAIVAAVGTAAGSSVIATTTPTPTSFKRTVTTVAMSRVATTRRIAST